MKFGFVTCVQLGLSCMEAIYQIGGTLDVIITLPDTKSRKKSGRIYPDEFAETHRIPLIKTPSINDQHAIEHLRGLELDWLFIIGWSQIARPEVLAVPSRGCIGMHPTLLPVGRGRASIPWAILKGLKKTGVTMFVLDEGVDTGPVLAQRVIEMDDTATATWLYGQVEEVHVELMRSTFPKLLAEEIVPAVQDEDQMTYWEGRTPADGEISALMTVAEAERLVRATTHPYPGAFVMTAAGKRIVWHAAFSSDDNVASAHGDAFKLKDGFMLPDEFTDE